MYGGVSTVLYADHNNKATTKSNCISHVANITSTELSEINYYVGIVRFT